MHWHASKSEVILNQNNLVSRAEDGTGLHGWRGCFGSPKLPPPLSPQIKPGLKDRDHFSTECSHYTRGWDSKQVLFAAVTWHHRLHLKDFLTNRKEARISGSEVTTEPPRAAPLNQCGVPSPVRDTPKRTAQECSLLPLPCILEPPTTFLPFRFPAI